MAEQGTPGEEGRLLELASRGDRQALDQLLAPHRAALRKFVEHRLDARLRGRVDASDVVQETEMEVLRRLPDFARRRPMPFRLWLRRTAFERLLKVRRLHLKTAGRTARREVRLPERSSLLLAQRLFAASTPSQQASKKEVAERVCEALAGLSKLDREILLLRTIDGFRFEAVACLLDLQPAAARKRYGRALLRLRDKLVEAGVLDRGS